MNGVKKSSDGSCVRSRGSVKVLSHYVAGKHVTLTLPSVNRKEGSYSSLVSHFVPNQYLSSMDYGYLPLEESSYDVWAVRYCRIPGLILPRSRSLTVINARIDPRTILIYDLKVRRKSHSTSVPRCKTDYLTFDFTIYVETLYRNSPIS